MLLALQEKCQCSDHVIRVLSDLSGRDGAAPSVGILCDILCIYIRIFLTLSYTSGGVIYSYEENFFLFLMLNPVMYLVEFFVRIMAGESLINEVTSITGITQTRGPINLVTTGNRWMIVSTILFLAVSFLFLRLAARRINPIKKRAMKQIARRAEQAAPLQVQVSGKE